MAEEPEAGPCATCGKEYDGRHWINGIEGPRCPECNATVRNRHPLAVWDAALNGASQAVYEAYRHDPATASGVAITQACAILALAIEQAGEVGDGKLRELNVRLRELEIENAEWAEWLKHIEERLDALRCNEPEKPLEPLGWGEEVK